MRVRISGIVQGVGFRPAVHRTAVSLGMKGRVWNDGSDVLIDVDDHESFLKEFKNNVPPLARIDDITIEDVPLPSLNDFTIMPSSEGSGGVGIPTDVAICDNCLEDMRKGRRKDYEFTSCTDCGARFTLISDLPYDRCNTAMSDFQMCSECEHEYNDPDNRRFHHQTICCPACGPRYYLIMGGKRIDDPIERFVELLNDGKIGVIKSWGGMHICAIPERITELRKWYGRPQKPFALMVKDVDALRKYAEPTEYEMEHVTSVHRPIVLMKKIPNNETELLSPGLDNIGIFLPYTGVQHRIFDLIDTDALIMTSANLPGEPMVLGDDDVMELGADMCLLHDQKIINRADDSVIRMNGSRNSFIRKSRGHIPSYIDIGIDGKAVGLGAQENITASVAINGKMYTTQHIGDGGSLGVPEYLESSSRALMEMLRCIPNAIAIDLHPGYSNRPLGKRLASEYDCELVEVQHHWAHAASLFADNGTERGTVLSVDGTGYGDDGNAWGGEVMKCDLEKYERIAHLQYIPLLGSEKALYDLRRLKFAIDDINGIDDGLFQENESNILRKMTPKSVLTSSFGRILDALSFTLGVCTIRTYDGEPAMKMEPLLARGKLIEGFETEVIGGVIQTADLFARVDKRMKREDVAYSIVRNIIDKMVESACDVSDDGRVGITGGVSYNGPICQMFDDAVKKNGFEPMHHDRVPNGDGGISVGQTAIALRRSS